MADHVEKEWYLATSGTVMHVVAPLVALVDVFRFDSKFDRLRESGRPTGVCGRLRAAIWA